MPVGVLFDAFRPISYLIGKWRTVSPGLGKFPTIKSFEFDEELEFIPAGETLLIYRSVSWDPLTRAPLYIDAGFLRINPSTNQLALLIAHNFGGTSVEETVLKPARNDCICFKTTNIGKMTSVRDPVENLRRLYIYKEDNDRLHFKLSVQTSRVPLTDHLHAVYAKVKSV